MNARLFGACILSGVIGAFIALYLTGWFSKSLRYGMPTLTTSVVSFGVGSEGFSTACRLTAVYAKDYSLFTVSSGKLPTNGASMSGDFSGFGKRTVHYDSANVNERINVIFHAANHSAILDELRRRGCFL